MVSANPNRPKGPLVSVSWSRPATRPTSNAEKELPPRPFRTTTTRNTSTVRPKPGHRLMPTKCTSAARAIAASDLRAPTGTVLLHRRRFHDGRQRFVIQEVDLVEGTEIDRRGELDLVEELAAAFHLDHGADRDSPRINAVDAGGEHLVAHPHVGLQRHVVELQGAAPPHAAADDALAAVAQDHGA